MKNKFRMFYDASPDAHNIIHAHANTRQTPEDILNALVYAAIDDLDAELEASMPTKDASHIVHYNEIQLKAFVKNIGTDIYIYIDVRG